MTLAVLHADQRNEAESKRLRRNAFHYHLHGVYIPVVGKKVYLKRNTTNPELAGKLKEVIKQVNDNKKWPKLTHTDSETVRNAKGKAVRVNSYSLLQDRFSEHEGSQARGPWTWGVRFDRRAFDGLEYKTQKEQECAVVEQKQESAVAVGMKIAGKEETAASLNTEIQGMEQTATTLDEKTEKKKKQLESLDKR
jgi:hypothetical protein